MSKKIKLSLSDKGIDGAIKELEEYKSKIERKSKLLTQRLAQLGASVASLSFSRAFYNGDNDVVISVEPRGENGYAIIASGEAVCFIEFGTGVGANHPQGAERGFTPGSWSIDHEQQYSKKGYWYYNGQKMIGSTPGRGMYDAAKEIRSQIEQIAREVFNSD